MANVKISELSAMAALDGTEVFPGVQGATTEKATADQLATYTESTLAQFEEGVRSAPDTGNPGFISIDVDLATGIAGGDTLTGGSAASEALTLASTSNATRGLINLRDRTILISENKTYSSGSGTFNLFEIPTTTTITLDHGTAGANGVLAMRFGATCVYEVNSATFFASLLHHAGTFKNATAETRTMGTSVTIRDLPTFTADDATVTMSAHYALLSVPVFGVTGGSGVENVSNVTTVGSSATINTGVTVTTRTGYLINDTTGSGTVTTMIGLDIPTLSHAGTSIGIRNASTEVHTPTTKAITAASDTIPITARCIRLNNTSGGSLTLTSAPTMADGVPGQVIRLLNTSSNNVVIQDQGTLASSNLRLTATGVTIGPRQSVQLMYNTTVGDWVQVSNLCTVI